jgi:hypothetical protein
MPIIPVNLGAVEAFENIPFGTYLGQIDKIGYREAKEQGKFASLMVTYTVIEEGDFLGRKQSEFLSFSPKALYRMKLWFAKFGLGDVPEFDVDDTTNELLEPDLVGVQVIFGVSKDGTRDRTELISVEDDMSEPVAAAPAPVRATRPAPVAVAAVEVVEEEEEEAVAEAVAAPVAPRRVTRAPVEATAARPAPQRRSLR